MGYEIAHAMKCPHSYGYSAMVQKAPWHVPRVRKNAECG